MDPPFDIAGNATLRGEALSTDRTLAADGVGGKPLLLPDGPFRIGRFTAVRQHGAGNMGVVYMAYDEQLDRKVAIKLLQGRPSADNASLGHARLLREAQAMAHVSHPNVAAVYEVGTFEEQVFVAMEFIEGKTLSAWLAAGPRSWREVVDVYVQAGRGLAAAHVAGLVHRDFKPETRSPLGHPLFSPTGRILKFRGVLRRRPWRVAPHHAAVLATGWQRRPAADGAAASIAGFTNTVPNTVVVSPRSP